MIQKWGVIWIPVILLTSPPLPHHYLTSPITKYIYIQSITVYVPLRNCDPPTPPLSPASVPSPLYQKGGGAQSPVCEGLGESQFRRLEKKLSTLPSLCLQSTSLPPPRSHRILAPPPFSPFRPSLSQPSLSLSPLLYIQPVSTTYSPNLPTLYRYPSSLIILTLLPFFYHNTLPPPPSFLPFLLPTL